MAESFAVSRAHLMYGVCLPLAVLVGYFLASPLDSDSMAVVILVLSVLSVPFLMRWNFPLMIFSWNAPIYLGFIANGVMFCHVMVAISMFFSLLNRSLGQNLGFFKARSVSRSLIFFGLVIGVTAWLTGGIGIRSLGSATFGGRKYVTLFLGILGYFALAVHRVPRERAAWCAGLFFLSGLVILVGFLAPPGPGGDYLRTIVPADSLDALQDGGNVIARFGNLNFATVAVFSFLLMRYGLTGVLDLLRPWRITMMVITILASLFSGFRSVEAMFILTFATLFYYEGLFRTRYFFAVLLCGALGAAILLPQVQKLPLSVQRTLSFLPIQIDQTARASADSSTEWRLEMWRDLLPEVPKYLILGKGYALNPDEMFSVYQSAVRGFGDHSQFAMYAGDYHSGPFSLIIPFGLFGVAAFIWFVVASIRLMVQNLQFGDPSLKRINTFLLAMFIARVLFFVLIFGSISSDLIQFTGLVGLSVCLNGAERRAEPEPAPIERPALLQESVARRGHLTA